MEMSFQESFWVEWESSADFELENFASPKMEPVVVNVKRRVTGTKLVRFQINQRHLAGRNSDDIQWESRIEERTKKRTRMA